MDFDIDLFSLLPLFVVYDNITMTWGLRFTTTASAEIGGNQREPEGTRGLSSAPSVSTGKVQTAHCVPIVVVLPRISNTQIRNPRPLRLSKAWFGSWCHARGGASEGRGHDASCAHHLRHSQKEIKEPSPLHIFPFCWRLPFFCYCSPFPFTFLDL